MTDVEMMRYLIDRLNYLTKKYDEGVPEVSDKEWDDLYFKLLALEQTSGQYFPDSPTRHIDYQVINSLEKVEHNHKMLSLDKTKNLEDVTKFANGKQLIVMSKCDGLTCSLRYIDGYLASAETRGDGVIGEDVLHNARVIPTIPNRINYEGELILDGEIVCLADDFKPFSEDYKNSRNFAAGSIRLLDSKECEKRHLTFVVWDVIKGFDDKTLLSEKIQEVEKLGFFACPYIVSSIITDDLVSIIQQQSFINGIPIDGVVFKFNNVEYGKMQGETAHHFKNAIAYKFYDEVYITTLRSIMWTMGRTGVLTPVALFDTVDIDGTDVERASLHNVSVMRETLGNTPWNGQKIGVYKANMIIPQINYADTDTIPEENLIIPIPVECPICGQPLKEKKDNASIFLECQNPDCEGKLVNRLDHFCGKKGLDIKGLSKATLEKLIDWGWVFSPVDIFYLDEHAAEWAKKPGFGDKSVQNILESIEDSKECTFEAFISALGIPLIGRTVAKDLAKKFACYEDLQDAIHSKYDFTQLPNFGESKAAALREFDYTEANQLYGILDVQMSEIETNTDQPLDGKKFVITGSVKHFKNRTELQDFIEKHGGKVVSTVSKNVDYLINNDATSTSSKNVAAKKMGIPILTEDEFLEKVN